MTRPGLFVLVGALLVPGIAAAHIHLSYPLHHTDSLTGDQKTEHCGTPGWDRTAHPDRTTVLAPGATITVTWLETVNHPGHYRIAFQPDGQGFTRPPAGNGPPAGYPDLDQTGQTLPDGSIILADFIADGTLTADVTLPAMTCDNCTLQLIQVMTDKPPYTLDAASNDLYFNCADLLLTNTPADAAPQPTVDADPGNPGSPDAGNPGGGGTTGGCSAGGGPSGILTALAMVGLIRRRRERVELS